MPIQPESDRLLTRTLTNPHSESISRFESKRGQAMPPVLAKSRNAKAKAVASLRVGRREGLRQD
jgi:hypothetical protein